MHTFLCVAGIIVICAVQSLITWYESRRQPSAYDVLLHVKGTHPRTGKRLKEGSGIPWVDFAMTEPGSAGLIGGGLDGGGCD